MEQLSQGKAIGMLTDKHFLQKSLGIRRTERLASTALPLMVMLMIMQSVLSACTATTPTAQRFATPSSYGCTSPSACVSKMTLAEKEGQMTQVENNAFTLAGNSIRDITTYFIGSVLSGGGGGPQGPGGTATQWADMADNFQGYALQTRLKIPLIYGADAVHGHNNVYGATLFPQNIGLGAMHDPALITQVEQATRDEVLGTGVRWTFAPCECTPQDIRWGRTYEGYSEVPSDNATNGAAAITGFQGTNGTLGPTNILATAKHFIGDGHTAWGTGTPYLNEGDDQVSEQQLDTIDLPPYRSAVSNKVASVMVSYSSWNGLKDHANHHLITDKLKGTGTDSYGIPGLGFQGFVVSDWQAIDQISSDYNYDVRTAITSGIDMVMVADDYKTFISTLDSEIKAGHIPISRIDDAVTRILTAKFAAGLFTQPYTNRSFTPNVGSVAHRMVARQAERESLVLLKNKDVLPLSKSGSYTLVVGGDHADNLGYQLGGWSITWQGGSGSTTTGTTLWQAIQRAGLSSSVKLTFVGTNTQGNYRGDVGIVAVGETPYAEDKGDTSTLALSSTDATEVSDVCSRVTKCIVLLFSGRPIIINTQLYQSSAFVAAWIGSTEGEGITDVLFGDYGFRGKLTYTWPKAVTQEPCNQNNGCSGALFPYGYGITPF
jgi:beta-glucosidase